jgi:tetratricopeptide (TPR) repeat protein
MSQWDQVSEEFARVSVAADEAPQGWERVRAHEGALRLAQSDGSFAEEFVARTDLTQALYWTPKDPRTLVHFAWLRQALDPARGLDQDDRDAVLWRLKWAVDLIEDLPEVGLDALVAAIDDVEQVFRGDGYHLRPVHAARARLAQAVGDDASVEHELAAWLAEPRDSRSDCQACELREQARLVLASDPARALELVTPVVAGELTCGDEPRACLSIDAELRLDRGDVDGAVTSFRRAWHLAQDDPGASDSVAACLRVLVRLGNTDRAVDLLLPRLAWLDELHTPRQRMWFAATAAFVLDRATAAGLAPDDVDGRPVGEVTGELHRTATGIAEAFDARYGSTVTSTTLAAAHDAARVPNEPTLPPTRLPATAAGAGAPDEAVPPSTDLLERARVVHDGLRSAGADLEPQTRAWLRDRDRILPVETPEQWAAASLLDRTSAPDAGGPEQHRALLDAALAAAHRAGDGVAVTRTEGELALLDAAGATHPEAAEAARARARDCAQRLEAAGSDAEAGGLWRRIAWFGGADDPAPHLVRAAAAYERAGLDERRLLCAIEGAMATAMHDPARAAGILQSLEPEVAGTPLLASMALDGRARIARSTGDLDEAVALLQRARAVRGAPRRARLAELAELCDVRVDQEAWAELEAPAADLVAAATEARDPVLLAFGQRFLGLAYVETGRPVEAAELLEAALPVLREHEPALVGPVGWALGNALLSLGQWPGARTAFATASAAFEADGRVLEAGHAQWRAGNAAWDAGDAVAAASHFDDAVDKARDSGTVGLYVEALRSRAALRADTGDLHAGLAELDGAIAAGERLAVETGTGEDEFDGEVLEPHVLRQGAHLLARHGEVDAAVERLARAEALVGHEFELVLRAEAAVMLADDDRLDVAEPRLRASIAELHAAGIVPTRVDAAGALARALDRAGRGDEAEEVWGRYGPDA